MGFKQRPSLSNAGKPLYRRLELLVPTGVLLWSISEIDPRPNAVFPGCVHLRECSGSKGNPKKIVILSLETYADLQYICVSTSASFGKQLVASHRIQAKIEHIKRWEPPTL